MLPSGELPFCSSPSSTQLSSKYMSNQCLKNICLKGYQIISCLNHPQAYIWSNLGQLSSFIPQYYSRCHEPYTFGEKHSGKPERDCRASAGCSSPHSDWLPVTGKKKATAECQTLYKTYKLNFFKISLLFWGLCWLFVALGRLSLVAVGRGYSSLQCMGFLLHWPLLLWSTGSRAHKLQ